MILKSFYRTFSKHKRWSTIFFYLLLKNQQNLLLRLVTLNAWESSYEIFVLFCFMNFYSHFFFMEINITKVSSQVDLATVFTTGREFFCHMKVNSMLWTCRKSRYFFSLNFKKPLKFFKVFKYFKLNKVLAKDYDFMFYI